METLRLQDGQVLHLEYHRRRLAASLEAHGMVLAKARDCAERMSSWAMEESRKHATGIYRASFTLSLDGQISLRCIPYSRPVLRSFRLVEAEELEYSYKYADRRALEAIAGTCGPNEVALVVQGGLLTDSTFSNIVCQSRSGELFTPANPLLRGTCRERCLEKGLLQAVDIPASEMGQFESIHLINAMNEPGDWVIPIRDPGNLESIRLINATNEPGDWVIPIREPGNLESIRLINATNEPGDLAIPIREPGNLESIRLINATNEPGDLEIPIREAGTEDRTAFAQNRTPE